MRGLRHQLFGVLSYRAGAADLIDLPFGEPPPPPELRLFLDRHLEIRLVMPEILAWFGALWGRQTYRHTHTHYPDSMSLYTHRNIYTDIYIHTHTQTYRGSWLGLALCGAFGLSSEAIFAAFGPFSLHFGLAGGAWGDLGRRFGTRGGDFGTTLALHRHPGGQLGRLGTNLGTIGGAFGNTLATFASI